MTLGCIKRYFLRSCSIVFIITTLLVIMGGSSFAGIEADVIPQVYNVDNFEDSLPGNNFPMYYPTGHGTNLQTTEVTDILNPPNKALKIHWSDYTLPELWWYSCTWDGNPNSILDATYYTHLILRVRGEVGGEDFHIQLQELGGNTTTGNATYFIENITTDWQEIAIPIRYFKGDGTPENPGIDLTKVQAVAFTFYDRPSGTVYVDDIRFAGGFIDNFGDSLSGENKLRNATGIGGTGITENADEDGAHKISWNYTEPGDKPYWYTNTEFSSPYAGFNPIYYNYLYFRIKGPTGGEKFKIDYHAPSAFVSVNSKDYFEITTDWQDVYIPLKSFTDQNVTRNQLDGIAFRFGESGDTQAGTIYIDDIELKYVKHDPIVTTGDKTFYKNYRRGFHIKAIDADGDPLVYSAENPPVGASIDKETGFILWKPDTNGYYPVTLITKEDRKDATVVRKNITITVQDYAGFVKPQSAGLVKLNGRELIVNNNPYKIKGVGYQPIPIGSQPVDPIDPLIFDRDFPLLVSMGCNTIRTWGDPGGQLLTAANTYGLKVCAGYWVDYELDPMNATVRTDLKSGFRAFVARMKNNGAILMWAIGNENNYHPLQNKKEWYSLINEMAQQAYEEEGAGYHPVAVVNGNFHNIGDMDMYADDAAMPYLDVWGSNVYPGYYFSGALNEFAELSDKPLWVSEYGVDAYHTTAWHYEGSACVVDSGYVDEVAQAEWDANSTIELLVSDVALGGTIMAYSDEWWKADGLSTHDPGGFPQDFAYEEALTPDRFMNEEYWGIVAISLDGEDPDSLDDVTPRQAYYKLKEIFTNASFSVVKATDSVKDVLENPASEDILYVEKGVYSEGAIDADGKTLISVAGADETIINGSLIFKESGGWVDGFQIVYSDGGHVDFVSAEYPDGIEIKNDAGITMINAGAVVKNCIIRPDLESMIPQPSHYGKGVQVWNLYNRANITPSIENNLIRNSNTAIFMFSQAYGGEIWGNTQYNTLDNNVYGIVERMRKENPMIKNNIITNSTDAIHLSYQDGALLAVRLGSIISNDFYGNTHNVWCDETQSVVTPTGSGNISEDPLYTNPPSDYTPLNTECEDKGCRLWNTQLTESFEAGWGMWKPDDDDAHDTPPRPETYTIVTLSSAQAYEGANSVSIYIEGTGDDGEGWIEKPVYLRPNTAYTMNMSFQLWSLAQSEVNNWSVIAYVGTNDPELTQDLNIALGSTNLVAGWREYTASKNVTTDSTGRLYVACGIHCSWEASRTYYVDCVSITFTAQ